MDSKMKHFLTIFYVALSVVAFGQPGVTITATGNRPVEPAYRISGSPKVIDTVVRTPVVNYPLLSLKYETTTEIERINPASIRTKEKLSQLYNSYAKLGVGTEFMPLGEFYFDSKRSRKYVYGAHLKHLSSFGDLPNYAPAQFDRTNLTLRGAINEKRYTVDGNLHFGSQGLHYYGAPDTLGLTRDSIAQRYTDIGFGASFYSHTKDSAKVNWKVGVDYNNYQSKKPMDEDREDWRARENFFGISSKGWYKLGKEVYAADVNVRYNGYQYGVLDSTYTNVLDTGIVLNNTIINLKPTITTRLKNNRFKAKVGLDLTFDIHNKTRVHIYPIAELKYSMFNDIFIPYAGLRGGIKQTTFKSLTNTNEFLLANVNMLNESTAIDFYGGIKGTLSKRVSFNASASFARVQNLALFVTDTNFSVGNQV